MSMKVLRFLFLILVLGLTSCHDEPKVSDDLPVKPIIQVICKYDTEHAFNSPSDPPEYVIINSARDLANLPEGYLDWSSNYEYSRINYAKKTLIVVTSVVYCEPDPEDDTWIWTMANFDFKKGYLLNIHYTGCSVAPTGNYTVKCKIQFGFTTDKIPSDTKLTLTESMNK